MRSRLALLAFFCAGIGAADELLERVRASVLGNLQRLPDFTCMETVDRSFRNGSGSRRLDTVRLESSYVGGREMISWPGQAPNERQTVQEIAGGVGLISIGDFALHVRALFAGNGAEFSAPVHEPDTVSWTFRVPREKSSYMVGNTRTSGAVVGYHGAFVVDAKSLELVRLEIVADNVPPATGLTASESAIDYARVRIADADFVLPSAARSAVTREDGYQLENRAAFTACRKFVGESSISFGEATADLKQSAPRTVKLPAGLSVAAKLVAPIDLERAAIGDTVHAVLVSRIRKGAEVYFSKGARLEGRISRLERHSPRYFVGLRFLTLEDGEKRAAVLLELEAVQSLDYRVSSPASIDDSGNVTRSTLPAQPARGEALFLTPGHHSRTPAGLRLTLRTLTTEE